MESLIHIYLLANDTHHTMLTTYDDKIYHIQHSVMVYSLSLYFISNLFHSPERDVAP